MGLIVCVVYVTVVIHICACYIRITLHNRLITITENQATGTVANDGHTDCHQASNQAVSNLAYCRRDEERAGE